MPRDLTWSPLVYPKITLPSLWYSHLIVQVSISITSVFHVAQAFRASRSRGRSGGV